MKKIITFLMAATMIFGFAGFAMAADECTTCTAPGTINRACDIEEQGSCYSEPFDYEDNEGCEGQYDFDSNYCDDPKVPRRVIFPACNCDNFVEGDVVDIRMEILVNGLPGNNGAYWAQSVDSIDVGTYAQASEACTTTGQEECNAYSGDFEGPFQYLYYNSSNQLTSGSPYIGGTSCSNLATSNRVTVIQPNAEMINGNCYDHGYVITAADDINNRAYWAINIPFMRFDQTIVQAGDVISVKICLAKAVQDSQSDPGCMNVDLGGICSEEACCCEFTVGTLGCCYEELTLGGKLIYPYATEMNSNAWWYGFVITNISSEDGQAVITVYETDGDTASITVDVAANNMYVANNQTLMAAFGGDIGDTRAYFQVDADFTASGFLFIGNDDKAEAMGYLPVSRPIYDAITDYIDGNLGGILDR